MKHYNLGTILHVIDVFSDSISVDCYVCKGKPTSITDGVTYICRNCLGRGTVRETVQKKQISSGKIFEIKKSLESGEITYLIEVKTKFHYRILELKPGCIFSDNKSDILKKFKNIDAEEVSQ